MPIKRRYQKEGYSSPEEFRAERTEYYHEIVEQTKETDQICEQIEQALKQNPEKNHNLVYRDSDNERIDISLNPHDYPPRESTTQILQEESCTIPIIPRACISSSRQFFS